MMTLKPHVLEAPSSPSTLGGVLAQLSIEVYPLEEVRAYQKKYLGKVRRSLLWKLAKEPILELAVFLTILLGGIAIFNAMNGHVWRAIIFSSFVACMIAFVGWLVSDVIKQIYSLPRWISEPGLSSRSDMPMPSSVRQTAIAVQAHLPGTAFDVEWCYTDPFLFAKYKEEIYCIAHWGEPGFEG